MTAPRIERHSGASWVADALRHRGLPPMSPLGHDVAEVLGMAYNGIYHLRSATLFHQRTEWHDPTLIALVVPGELATWDGGELAALVVGSLHMGIRLAVRGSAPGYLGLWFSRFPASLTPGKFPEPRAYLDRLFARIALYDRSPTSEVPR